MKILIFCLILFFSRDIFASLSVQTLRPSNNFTYTTLEDSLSQHYLLEEYEPDLYLNVQYNTINSPISLFDVNNQNRIDLVKRISSIDLSVQKPITKKLSLAADFSLNEVDVDDLKRFGVNDLRIQTEYQLLDKNKKYFGASLLAEVYLPTGNRNYFLSNGSVGTGGKLALEKNFPFFSTVFNFGFLKFGDAEYRNLNYSEQVTWGVGINLPLGKKFAMNLEGNSTYLPKDKFSSGTGEMYLGGQYALAYNSRFVFGASYSQTEEDNTADIRILLGYKLLPFMKEPVDKSQPVKIIERERVVEKVIEKVEVRNQVVQCGPKRYAQKFMARPITNLEISQLKLPYKTSATNKITNIKIGSMTGMSNGVPYVTNGQVLFAVDLSQMPDENSIISFDSARLNMDVRKIAKDSAGDTEILCILNNKICSGELYEDPKRSKNINFAFFEGKETPNDYFSKQYLDTPVGTVGNRKIYAADLILDLKKVIENSLVRDIKDIFYRNGYKTKALFFAVADDTYISNNAHIDISMTVDSCKMPGMRKTKINPKVPKRKK